MQHIAIIDLVLAVVLIGFAVLLVISLVHSRLKED